MDCFFFYFFVTFHLVSNYPMGCDGRAGAISQGCVTVTVFQQKIILKSKLGKTRVHVGEPASERPCLSHLSVLFKNSSSN